jgi:hypothetical protein
VAVTKRVNGNNGNGLSISDPNHPLNTIDNNGNVVRRSPKGEAYDFVAHQTDVIKQKEADIKQLLDKLEKVSDLYNKEQLKVKELELDAKLFQIRQPSFFQEVMKDHGEVIIKGIYGVVNSLTANNSSINGSPNVTNYDFIPNSPSIMECISELNFIANQDPHFVENIRTIKVFCEINRDTYLTTMENLRNSFK